MKVFVAHLIVMGILKKNSPEQYWSRDSILNTPVFGHYMSRNHFQNILLNLHISDPDETNSQKGEANHDPLFLVRPMVDMIQRNFCTKYRTGKELSLDESTCPFKAGSISSVITQKIQTGSILNFLWSVNLALATFVALKFIQEMHLASHRVRHRNYRMHQKLLALSYVLLDSVQSLDIGHHVYFDNYYNSPDLIDLLHKRKCMHVAQSGKIESHSL